MLLYSCFVAINTNYLYLFVIAVLGKKYFVFRMIRIWNELPNVIVCSNVFTAFKRRLHEYDLSKNMSWTD